MAKRKAKKTAKRKAKKEHFMSCNHSESIHVYPSDINKLIYMFMMENKNTCKMAEVTLLNSSCSEAVVRYLTKSEYITAGCRDMSYLNYTTSSRACAPFFCKKGLKCKKCWKDYNRFVRSLFNDYYDTAMFLGYLEEDDYGYLEEDDYSDLLGLNEQPAMAKRSRSVRTNVTCKPVFKYEQVGNKGEFVVAVVKPPFRIDAKGHRIG